MTATITADNKLTIHQLHQKGMEKMKKNAGQVFSITFFSLCIFVFLMLCDMITFLILKKLGFGWMYTISGLKHDKSGLIFWIIKI